MKTKQLVRVAGVAIIVGLALSGCTNSSPTKHGSSSSSTSAKTTSNKQSSTLWNSDKDKKLSQFMDAWAPTMNQSYEKYSGSGNIRTKAGMQYPRDLDKTTVNGTHDSIGWSPSGKGAYAYNVVAIYNYDRPGNAATHITYAFAFHDGQPVALVEQSTNGTPDWTPTKNTDVANNFAQIAQGHNSSFKSHHSANISSSKVHLTGGQSSVDYIKAKMGDQGWTVQGGTYGGAHGAPKDGSYVPYNVVQNSKGDRYFVYQDGRIKKQDD